MGKRPVSREAKEVLSGIFKRLAKDHLLKWKKENEERREKFKVFLWFKNLSHGT